MVERPIKKADRQNSPAEGNDTPKSAEAPTKKNDASRNKDGGKDGGKSKGKRDRDSKKRDDAQPPMNLALMRGPKPSKAKPPVLKEEAEPEVSEETATEEATAETEAETTAEG